MRLILEVLRYIFWPKAINYNIDTTQVMVTPWHGNPSDSSVFPPQSGTDVNLLWFLCCKEQALEQTIGSSMIWDSTTLTWHHWKIRVICVQGNKVWLFHLVNIIHDSCVVSDSAEICCDILTRNGITVKQIVHGIRIVMKKALAIWEYKRGLFQQQRLTNPGLSLKPVFTQLFVSKSWDVFTHLCLNWNASMDKWLHPQIVGC